MATDRRTLSFPGPKKGGTFEIFEEEAQEVGLHTSTWLRRAAYFYMQARRTFGEFEG